MSPEYCIIAAETNNHLCPNVVSWLCQRLRRWHSPETTLGRHPASTVDVPQVINHAVMGWAPRRSVPYCRLMKPPPVSQCFSWPSWAAHLGSTTVRPFSPAADRCRFFMFFAEGRLCVCLFCSMLNAGATFLDVASSFSQRFPCLVLVVSLVCIGEVMNRREWSIFIYLLTHSIIYYPAWETLTSSNKRLFRMRCHDCYIFEPTPSGFVLLWTSICGF